MKRSPLRPSITPLRAGKPLKAVGPALAKRKARTRKARQSAHTRQWRKDVLARDGHRCTAVLGSDGRIKATFATGGCEVTGRAVRCPGTETLHVHHVDSKRMGEELVRDGVSLCAEHHRYIESQLRWYRRTPA